LKIRIQEWHLILKVFPSLSQSDSDWSFEPRRGFTLKNQKIHLLSKDLAFICVGILDFINGKRVNVTRKKINQFIATTEYKLNLTSEVFDLSKFNQTTDIEVFFLHVIGTVNVVTVSKRLRIMGYLNN
jgi:hypothetical protein